MTPAGNVEGPDCGSKEVFSILLTSDNSMLAFGLFVETVLSEDVDSLTKFLGFGVEVFLFEAALIAVLVSFSRGDEASRLVLVMGKELIEGLLEALIVTS